MKWISTIQRCGVVLAHTNNKIRIILAEGRTGDCNGCTTCAPHQKPKVIEVNFPEKDGFGIGEKVKVIMQVVNPAVAGFMLFGIPLLMLTLFITVIMVVIPAKASHPLSIMLAMIALSAGFIWATIFDSMLQRKLPPLVVRFDESTLALALREVS